MRMPFRNPFATRVAMLIRNALNTTRIFARAAIFITAAIFLTPASHASTNYLAHEWGTFTSVQGSDGKLLAWRPFESSELPKFVYSSSIGGILVKPSLITYQRLETPVIYFYSQDAMKVTVDVRFPHGLITEWYPNVNELTAAYISTNGTKMVLQQEGHAVWRDIDILADHQNTSLLQYGAANHYFAARATSANLVRASITTNNTTELEKFIFYRGAGNFKTPLRVTVDTNNLVTVENTGNQTIPYLICMHIHNGKGDFESIAQLAPGGSWSYQPLSDTDSAPWVQFDQPGFKNVTGYLMQSALTNSGLYPDEAQAMVNTWRDSWFTEDGVRVIYLLPRPWTDEILPLTLTPKPAELTRVMVGRAEVIMPEVETNLFQLMNAAYTGDTNAQAEAVSELKHLGRFSDPALNLALSHTTNSALRTFSYQLAHPPQPGQTFE
jgi:hypothetical protein